MGKLAQTLGKIADLVILKRAVDRVQYPGRDSRSGGNSVLFLALKMIKNEEAYVTSSFFKAFRENFKQSLIVTLILLAVAAVLGCDFYFCTTQGLEAARPFFILFCVIAVFVYMGSCYIFPIMAFF